MTILQILYFPNKRLRKVAELVKKINKEVQNTIDDMFDTMYIEKGIGLAATQVDIHQQIIVIDISRSHNDRLVLINPEIMEKSGRINIEEGCLSIPDYRAMISRAEKIKVRALDRNGKLFEFEARGLLAVCVQHEMDHLIGKLFIDYLSTLKQHRIYHKIEKTNRLISNKSTKSLKI